MTTADESRPVREEDSFDVEAVTAWLREHAEDPGAVPDGTPEVRQFPGGASNLTYLLRWSRLRSTDEGSAPTDDGGASTDEGGDSTDEGGDSTDDGRASTDDGRASSEEGRSGGGRRDLILRRPPVGAKARSAHDMGREYTIQRALAPVYPYVARMVGLCRDESVIGSDFYVMERLDGLILRQELPFELTADQASALCEHAWEALVRLHQVDVTGVPDLAALGRGEGYVARQVAGWTDRLARATTDDLGDWSPVTSWLHAHQPPDAGQCLIHNDWRFDNMVLDPGHGLAVRGVLDWEMATVGDPLMDLGGALAYWIQADDDEFFQAFRRQPTTAPGMWTREQVVAWYGERTGLSVTPEQWRFYEVFGLFRLAVIAQQIWYRYFHGQTHNEAYAVFGPAVAYLEKRCRSLVSTGSTDGRG